MTEIERLADEGERLIANPDALLADSNRLDRLLRDLQWNISAETASAVSRVDSFAMKALRILPQLLALARQASWRDMALTKEARDLVAALSALRAESEKLRGALRPFAEAAAKLAGDDWDSDPLHIVWGSKSNCITETALRVSDLRLARAALEAPETKKDSTP